MVTAALPCTSSVNWPASSIHGAPFSRARFNGSTATYSTFPTWTPPAAGPMSSFSPPTKAPCPSATNTTSTLSPHSYAPASAMPDSWCIDPSSTRLCTSPNSLLLRTQIVALLPFRAAACGLFPWLHRKTKRDWSRTCSLGLRTL